MHDSFDPHPMYKSNYYAYRKCEVRSCGHHCVHQRPYCSLLWNFFHFVQMLFILLFLKLQQWGLCVERNSNRITHAKLVQNDFHITFLIYCNGTGSPIPLEMNSEEEMQLTDIIHLEFVLEARLQFVNQIVCQNDEVIYIYDNNHNVMANL